MDHFAFTALAFDTQIRFCQHLAQALETAIERVGWHLEEKVGGAFAGAGVDLSAHGLYVAHQAVFQREARCTEEEQVFEEVRQTGPSGSCVVAARMHPQCGGRAFEARGVAQGQLQAVGEGELASGVRHGGSGGCFPC